MAENMAESSEAARLSRRAALKAGVAAGVGAAALAGPQIGLLGASPAFADHCSPAKFISDSGPDRNVDCNSACTSGTYADGVVRLHEEGLSVVVGGSTVTVTVPDLTCSNDPTAFNDLLNSAGIPSGYECQLQVVLTAGPASGQAFTLPAELGPAQGNYCSTRYQVKLVCAPDGCFA